ncbi:MAG TPA: tetratricopeptide repeat protein [Candidatus Dormibacteraeota bacterium]|jgi:tetratricopeptide (TPR) repeat protein|nr:tetratricopeptide repeat protein [Candidatus Dormibacteraeota bacterium]
MVRAIAAAGRRGRLAGALVLATCVVSCSFPPSVAGKPSPSATSGSGGGGPALDTAKSAFFANKYADAEAAFQSLLSSNPRSVDGHAFYALFLNYNHRFPEAQDQVNQALNADPNSVIALAINTRVHDWAAGTDHAGLKTAADIGAQAVKAGPRSSLAHAFYSEALADSGDPASAQSQIDAAAPLAADEYEKAEVERERANLAGDTGDKSAQLAHFKAARDIQPKWAERTRELAGYFFTNGDPQQGVTLLKTAIDMNPNDAGLRLYLGGIALEQQDITVAADALGAANSLKPHDAAVESSLAMSVFTLHHNVAEAETLLRRANADAPTSAPIANLLYGFLRYIKGDEAAANQVRVSLLPVDTSNPLSGIQVSVNANRQVVNAAALNTLNDYRAKAGLKPVHLDDRISAGAESHSYWWLFNLSNPGVKGLGIHKEVAGTPGYTGFTMRDRAVHFGFPANLSMAEVIDHEGTPKASVQVWIDSVYHRFPLMSPLLDAVGFGESFGGGLPMETMDMSFQTGRGEVASMVAYPADNQVDIPRQFTGNELPDPVPGGYKSPTGYPITVNFNPFVNILVGPVSVKDQDGNDVLFYTLPPVQSDENVLTILPKQPLKSKTTYKVHIQASVAGAPLSKDWSFTTES